MEGGVPLLVRPAGLRVVCVGAGPVAAAKLRGLLAAGARVEVVAPEATAAIRAAAADGRLDWRAAEYTPGVLDGAYLVLAATADAGLNERVAAEAADRAILCVRLDDAAAGTAAFMGAVTRGPLTLAVSSGAPALSRALREELAARYGPEHGELAALLGSLRRDPGVRAALEGLSVEARRAKWRALPLADMLKMIREGQIQSAKEVAAACLCSSSD